MEYVLDFITQIETLIGIGVAGFLGLVYSVRKYLKSGVLVISLVSYAGSKVINMLTSDDPAKRERASNVLNSILALPAAQDLSKKIGATAEAQLANFYYELADIEAKLESGLFSENVKQKLLVAKSRIEKEIAKHEVSA